MQLGSSETQVYYHLLDLDDSQKQQYLQELQQSQPELYIQLAPLLAHEAPEERLTQLLYFGAHQATNSEIDLSGEVISKYRLTHELGRGGMGVVYAAQRADETFEQDLAIKFIQSNLSNVLGQRALFDEAQLLARLNHPYIAKVFDGGLHDDSVYIVMERVFGQTLDDYLAEVTLTDREKLTLFKQICQAMEHAHHHHVLHADLKPENILIDPNKRPKLLDFNLTQKVQNSGGESPPALIAFSQNFASPEQQTGQFLTAQSDVYSLGKILAMMFPSPRVWSDVYWVIRRATRSAAKLRYSDVRSLRIDIERMLERRPIEQKKHWPLYSTLRLVQRRPLAAALSAILVLSGVLFGNALIQKNIQLQQEKKIAEDMMYELTRLIFHAKGQNVEHLSVNSMMELTRRRILSNPDIPKHIKQKMLLAMMTPVPEKHLTTPMSCQPNCASKDSTNQ
ncbi:serine/threonine protein kinase [Vibrio parahaemolyticus]|uniref:serine/threonine-protein kinase n=1 Tax=Vibrio parahaemolyticus TaxID=670 RepID=UPI000415817A|nr:serine/threonine-protein kinase [Vibrio parahaemolyticus]EGQ7812483.1 serine/threonine protein kinase [Vibrio parahaemolyticus]EIA1620965.1 serine/threonine protein kinase [Vibrio parahaemolyticus]EIU6868364.1 serine/threonine protein kinase [Vibrio parahaemolyticus]EIV8632420.1 serine/threonine protein kinase [Vibrio parahaemolyticus]EIZ1446147.1 serine/threonine protein kinase [Vibrio parahaemolyticus]